jgi:hypothetical protein
MVNSNFCESEPKKVHVTPMSVYVYLYQVLVQVLTVGLCLPTYLPREERYVAYQVHVPVPVLFFTHF